LMAHFPRLIQHFASPGNTRYDRLRCAKVPIRTYWAGP
jgi:hypothetical protein